MPSIEEHCCGADQLFDQKTAKKQYKSYLKKGPSKVTKRLIEQLKKVGAENALIDVGGGIGAIQWWFLENGGQRTYGMDASTAYTAVAKEHAEKKSWTDQAEFFIGDFTDLKENVSRVDHVTMDKLICCYPDYRAILEGAAEKANKSIHISYPMDGIIADIFRGMGVIFMKLKGSSFRPYVHKVKDLRQKLNELGFEKQEGSISFPWHVEAYVKEESSGGAFDRRPKSEAEG